MDLTAFLSFQLFDNTLLDWVWALGIAICINLLVGALKWAITARLARFNRNVHSVANDALIDVARRTRQFLILGMTLFVGTRYLNLPARVETVFTVVATVCGFLQVGLWMMGIGDFWLNRYRRKAAETDGGVATSIAALAFTGRLVMWSLIILLMLGNLGVDITALVAGLGVSGIAVALAAQNILGDLFASLSIVIDKPFVIGDYITIDEFAGTIEYVGLKTTRIRSLGGEQIVFSNTDLTKARVRNYKRMMERRIAFTFGVTYQTRPDQMAKIPQMIADIINAQPQTRFERAHFARFNDSSMDVDVVYWMLDPSYARYMDTQQAINLAMLRQFNDAKIEFAYPTQTVFVAANATA